MKRHTNPYHGMPLEVLGDAMHARAADLQARRARSPAEREALADDTAMLLLTAAAAIAPGRNSVTAPERDLDSAAGFADTFARWNEQLVKGCRYRVLVRAADAALGSGARLWIQEGHLGGQRAYDLALASDEGLRLVLAELELHRCKRDPAGH